MRPDLKYVVGIESSTAGLMGLTYLFSSLPSDTGMAFAVVSHIKMPEKFHLSEILARFTMMPVVDAVPNMELRENHVYVIPKDAHLYLDGNSSLLIFLHSKTPGKRTQLNHFLISLAKAAGKHSMAIITSGAHGDGVEGGKFICEQGGHLFFLASSVGIDGTLRTVHHSNDSGHAIQPEEIAQQIRDFALRHVDTNKSVFSSSESLCFPRGQTYQCQDAGNGGDE